MKILNDCDSNLDSSSTSATRYLGVNSFHDHIAMLPLRDWSRRFLSHFDIVVANCYSGNYLRLLVQSSKSPKDFEVRLLELVLDILCLVLQSGCQMVGKRIFLEIIVLFPY